MDGKGCARGGTGAAPDAEAVKFALYASVVLPPARRRITAGQGVAPTPPLC